MSDHAQRLYDALHKIAKEYMTPGELRRVNDAEYGLDYEEALVMACENMQEDAQQAIQGMRRPKT